MRRRGVIHLLGEKALEMERQGLSSDAIFHHIQDGLEKERIGWGMGVNVFSPLADHQNRIYPRQILAAFPGHDQRKPLTGGWAVWYEGAAKVIDDQLESSKWA